MTEEKWKLKKRSTGISGLDQLTHGGLPSSQASLIVGHTGAGKTVLTLQILANAISEGYGGVFVSFEESPNQVRRNVDSFRWGQALNQSKAWFTIDARLPVGAEGVGTFDIDALLAGIQARVDQLDQPWIVIDGIDQLLQHQPDHTLALDQIRQINEHCEEYGWTLLLSGKAESDSVSPRHLQGVEYMLSTTLMLTTTTIDRRLHRYLRVAKYRGSGHEPDQVPLVIDDDGIQLPYEIVDQNAPASASKERVSCGNERLDKLLDGGPYRGSSTLISGRPGTAKSTLSASFAEAAAKRGERVLYVSFDEVEAPFVRNLTSVGVKLQPHIDAHRVRFHALSAHTKLIAEHVFFLQQQIREFEPQLLIIDPVSALLKADGGESARSAVARILDHARSLGVTTILTALTADGDIEDESTSSDVSTIADTWIVLDYNVRGGERNRSLSIVKSRGTAHSNQERELVLSSSGIDLADVYEYGTDVLMGTARLQKEMVERAQARSLRLEHQNRLHELERRLEQARNESERLSNELRLESALFDESKQVHRDYTDSIRAQRDPASQGKEGDQGE